MANGLFKSASEACEAAAVAQKKLVTEHTFEDRDRFIQAIRDKAMAHMQTLAQMEYDETGYGRVEDKVAKNTGAVLLSQGTEAVPKNIYASDKGLTVDVLGSGATVVRQFPTSGTLPRGGKVTLYTEAGLSDTMATVPDVTGFTVSATEQALTAAGLNLRKDGSFDSASSVAMSQDVAAGTQVPAGTVITVNFHNPNVSAD